MISKLLLLVLTLFSGLATPLVQSCPQNIQSYTNVKNGCISFSVSQGTGCQWMCNYCSNQLGTNNYYFTDDICTYDSGLGYCTGNPIAGKQYTCCSAGFKYIEEL